MITVVEEQDVDWTTLVLVLLLLRVDVEVEVLLAVMEVKHTGGVLMVYVVAHPMPWQCCEQGCDV
jgi:hypothetical protein